MSLVVAQRRRIWGVGVALFFLMLFVASQDRRYSFATNNGYFVALRCSTLQVGWDNNIASGVVFDHDGLPFGANAWRPFRCAGAEWNLLIFPLWQPLMIAVACAAYLHGVVVAIRRRDLSRCARCGYSLLGLVAVNGILRCPECAAERRVGDDSSRQS